MSNKPMELAAMLAPGLTVRSLTTWEERFLGLATTVASWSKDPNSKVGALVVAPDKRSFSPGYNGFPKGIDDSEVRLGDKELKNKLMVHAEANAIFNAKADLNGWDIFVTRACCHDCAKLIVQSGIKRVILPEWTGFKSSWHESIGLALTLFSEAGVEVIVSSSSLSRDAQN